MSLVIFDMGKMAKAFRHKISWNNFGENRVTQAHSWSLHRSFKSSLIGSI